MSAAVRVLSPGEVLAEVLGGYEPTRTASDRLYGPAPAKASPVRIDERPRVVTLCGSTRFKKQFEAKTLELTLAGVIVLSVGCFTRSDHELGITPDQKAKLDALHLRKIDISDSILVLNLDGYIGESTLRELAYAIARSKRVDFIQPEEGAYFLKRYRAELGKLVAGYG